MAYHVEGLSHAEIAARTGLSVSGVEKQMGRAFDHIFRVTGLRRWHFRVVALMRLMSHAVKPRNGLPGCRGPTPRCPGSTSSAGARGIP